MSIAFRHTENPMAISNGDVLLRMTCFLGSLTFRRNIGNMIVVIFRHTPHGDIFWPGVFARVGFIGAVSFLEILVDIIEL
jgi:hypothetical protein